MDWRKLAEERTEHLAAKDARIAELAARLESMTVERNLAVEEMSTLKAERDALQRKLKVMHERVEEACGIARNALPHGDDSELSVAVRQDKDRIRRLLHEADAALEGE